MSFYDPIHAENEQKDLIIAKLKQEAFELRQKEREYTTLQNTCSNMEHKQNSLFEDKRRNEADMASKFEYQATSQKSMMREIDDLKLMLDDQSRIGANLETDCHAQLKIGDQMISEMERLRNECYDKGDMNTGIRQDIQDQDQDLLFLQEDVRKQQHALSL
jgi:hypothetical protein